MDDWPIGEIATGIHTYCAFPIVNTGNNVMHRQSPIESGKSGRWNLEDKVQWMRLDVAQGLMHPFGLALNNPAVPGCRKSWSGK